MSEILGLILVFTFTVMCLIGAGFIIYRKNLKNENEFLLLKKIDEELD